MCVYFDKSVPRQCREDGAEDVTDKDRPNFCDWFKPSDKAYDASANADALAAQDALAALFSDDGYSPPLPARCGRRSAPATNLCVQRYRKVTRSGLTEQCV